MAKRASVVVQKNTIEAFCSHKFSAWGGLSQTLSFIDRELGRLGLDPHELRREQSLSDLREPLDEDALAEMLDWWRFDLDKLIARRRNGYQGPAKPRVDLTVEVTTKGNLKVEWFPRGWGLWGPIGPSYETDTDFRNWLRLESRNGSFHSRPSNELLFIHDVAPLIWTLNEDPQSFGGREQFSHLLLYGCYQAIERLKERLERSFEVRCITDLIVEIEDRSSALASNNRPFRLKRWEVVDVEKHESEAALKILNKMRVKHGSDLELFLECWRKELLPKSSGLKPAERTLASRVAKALRTAGGTITAGEVSRYMDLVKAHQPSLLPAEESPTS